MELSATIVFDKNYQALESGARFIVNEGGSRSSKTYSLCQLLVVYCYQNPRSTVSIVRKAFPSLRASVYRDLIEVLQDLNIYDKRNHNKSEHIYTFDNGSMIEFFSVDDEQKIRGRKRDVCWCNEANELLYDDFNQLNMRTTECLIFDYNPSESSSWLYELPEEDTVKIHSTYKDNPFLEEGIIKAIEDLQRTDEDLYNIYALGLRTSSKLNIYSGWTFLEQRPERFQQFVYGLDFGYNHPLALIKVYWHEKDIFIEPVIYESYLDPTKMIERFEEKGVSKSVEIIADHARPELISELLNNGYNVYKANKEVKDGINSVKTFKVYSIKDKDIITEYENYKWKKVKDDITDEPVKLYDDAMDSVRYAVKYIRENYVMDGGYISFN